MLDEVSTVSINQARQAWDEISLLHSRLFSVTQTITLLSSVLAECNTYTLEQKTALQVAKAGLDMAIDNLHVYSQDVYNNSYQSALLLVRELEALEK